MIFFYANASRYDFGVYMYFTWVKGWQKMSWLKRFLIRETCILDKFQGNYEATSNHQFQIYLRKYVCNINITYIYISILYIYKYK